MKGNVFFSTARNKAGNLITYLRYGEMCARGYSEAVAHPRNPKTSAQQLQRAKMKVIGMFFKGAAVILRSGLSAVAYAQKMAAYSMAVKLNFQYLTGSTPESVTIDPVYLKISAGSLVGVKPSPTIDNSTPGKLIITIDDSMSDDPGADADDIINVVCLNADTQQWVRAVSSNRSAHTVEVTIPSTWEGQEAHAYCYTTRGSEASETAYVGHTTVQ